MQAIKIWKKWHNHDQRTKIDNIKENLANIQMELMHNRSNDYLWLQEQDLQQLIQRYSIEQEICCTQRAHQTWTKLGNTKRKYFQTIATIINRHDIIRKIKEEKGNWFKNLFDILRLIDSGFNSGFRRDTGTNPQKAIPLSKDLTEANSILSTGKETDMEILQIAKQISSLMSIGQAICMLFSFKKNWYIIGKSVRRWLKSFLTSGYLLKEINKTNITLFLQSSYSEKVSHFRLVSLCNVSYKTTSKFLADIQCIILHKIIFSISKYFHPTQKTFMITF